MCWQQRIESDSIDGYPDGEQLLDIGSKESIYLAGDEVVHINAVGVCLCICTVISERRVLHQLGSRTIVISMKRAFKCHLFPCVFISPKLLK